MTVTMHTSAPLSWSPDRKIIAAKSNFDVDLFDATTRKALGPSVTGHTKDVLDLAWSPDSKVLASTGQDGSVLLWSVPHA